MPRSTAHYQPQAAQGASGGELAVMLMIDKIHVRHPFKGSRRITLGLHGLRVNRKRVRRLMLRMGITAIYPKQRTTKAGRGPGHKVSAYLLSGLEISAANDVWSADITYIPMARGFCYLVAIMDVFSRRVLAWRLSNTVDARFCIEALEEALQRNGAPEKFTATRARRADSTGRRNTSVVEVLGRPVEEAVV